MGDFGRTKLGDSNTGSGGGVVGTTVTRTIWEGNLESGIENGILITHPEVTDEENLFVIAKALQAPNSEGYFTSELVSYRNTSQYWTYTDLNTSERTWIKGTGNFGKFSGAKDAEVQAGCTMKIGASEHQILAITGDGTGDDSVELNYNPADSGAIEWIHAGDYSNGLLIGLYYNGSYIVPIDIWYIIEPTLSSYYSETYQNLASTLGGFINNSIYRIGAGMRIKAAFTNDGGTTLYYHDGTEWLSMTREEFATKGLEYNYSQYRWETSIGTEITAEMYAEFSGGNITGKAVAPIFSFFSSSVTGYTYIQGQAISVNEKASYEQLPIVSHYGSTAIRSQSFTPTQTLVWNGSYATLNDVIVTIYTLS